jgi:hypothetical protein
VVYAAGCAGTNGVPRLAAVPGSRPWLGDQFRIEAQDVPSGAIPVALAFGASRTRFGSFALPLDLSPFGMPGCALHASFDFVATAIARQGSATFSIPLQAPAMPGTTVFQQALVLDPDANPAGVTLSDAAELRVGVR